MMEKPESRDTLSGFSFKTMDKDKKKKKKRDDGVEIKDFSGVGLNDFGTSPLRMKPDYGERDMLERTASAEPLFNGIVDSVLKELSLFQYGCCFMDGICEQNMARIDEKDGRDIRIQSPLEFWNRRVGMCHDASVLVDAMMEKEGIDHMCYYIRSDRPPHYPTHSFIIAIASDGYKRIIDVFSTPTCVYPTKFATYADASEWRYDKWIEDDNGGNQNAELFTGKYMPYPKCDFMTFEKRIKSLFIEDNF